MMKSSFLTGEFCTTSFMGGWQRFLVSDTCLRTERSFAGKRDCGRATDFCAGEYATGESVYEEALFYHHSNLYD